MRRIHLLATHVIANSEAAKRLLVEDFRIPAERVHVLHNGLDFEQFAQARGDRRRVHPKLAPEAKLILNVANMNSEIKGHGVLIEAARLVSATMPEARFAFVGDGLLRPHLEERVRALGLQGHIYFLGPRKDVPEILASGDVFAFSSLAEGLPNAVLEAMAVGLPVVATRVGGIPEIIRDGASGLLVPPNDPQALAKAILRVLSDPALAAKLACASQARARSQFSFDRLIEDLEKRYSRL